MQIFVGFKYTDFDETHNYPTESVEMFKLWISRRSDKYKGYTDRN